MIAPEASHLVRFAGYELGAHLKLLYPEEEFPIVGRSSATPRIEVGVSGVGPCAEQAPSAPDAFVVRSAGGVGCIAAGDPRGALYGVYALLERLGFGFYLSYTATPEPRGSFGFDAWELTDKPLFRDRLVFNWHNFLSSASTWDLDDWRQYIDQAARMRYSCIMVHAYGNNPMFAFEHNGVKKPVGYLSTTRSGRDWGTQHVNDARRLYGAAGVLDKAEFGASAAKVPEDQRVAAATSLMQKVFRHAEGRGMEVVFAVDVDTLPANPQEIIRTLPESARFQSGDVELPNPDTPAGEDYFRSLVNSLLGSYPEIDQVVVWHRKNRTPWLTLKPADLPAAWREPFEAAMREHPELAGDEYAAPMFALGRVMAAFDRLIDETGRRDVQVASGSWDFAYFSAAAAMFPKYVKLMPLDWSVVFESDAVQNALKAASKNREVSPIVWAHHDDHTYIGRPYRPFDNFADILESHDATGFGIIHWTTRPLDFYFQSLARQVWQATRNEPIDVTARDMARRSFGPEVQAEGEAYLMRFISEGPMFGRETTNRFIDRRLGDTDKVARLARARRSVLESMPKQKLTDTGLDVWSYFRSLERFIEEFFLAHNDLERSMAALEAGNLAKARKDIGKPVTKPEAVIERYGIAIRQGEVNRGEAALLVSLNLRWLPYFRAQKQVLGMEPLRVNFQPTQHDPLAQGAGKFTYFFEEDGTIWKCLGQKETGVAAFDTGALDRAPDGWDAGLLRSGLLLAEPVTHELTALGDRKLLDGERTIEFYYLDDSSSPARLLKTEGRATVADGKLPVTLRPHPDSRKLAALIVR